MTIKEIEARSGMTRANVRFYESEGLLRPERKENGYREYSEDDLATLLRIRLLRSLGVSLEDIRALQSGEAALPDTLQRQLDALLAEQKSVERSQKVCREMLDDGAEYATLDAPRYLDALSRETPAIVPQEDKLPRVRSPWRRFFARALDEALCTALWVMLLLAMNCNPATGGAPMRFVHALMGSLIQLGLEPLFLSKLGTTPGKWLLGLSVTDADGSYLSYGAAATRLLCVWWYGNALDIPPLNLYRLYKSYDACDKGEVLPWETDSVLALKDEAPWRAWAYVGARLAIVAVMLLALLLTLLPKHRGEITVDEFCENYNKLVDFLDREQFFRLDAREGWVARPTDSVYVSVSSTVRPPLTFLEENGYMTGVRFEESLVNSESVPSSCNAEMQFLLMTFAASQKGAVRHLAEIKDAVGVIAENGYRSFDVEACGIRTISHVSYTGYEDFGGMYLFPIDEPTTFSIEFTLSK